MIFKKTVTETERLIIQTWDERNPEELVNLCADDGLQEYGSKTYTQMTVKSALDFMHMQNLSFVENHTGKFAVLIKATNELIGISGLFEMDEPFSNNFEINYRFKRSSWGKGYGAEAAQAMVRYGFEKLGQQKVYASVGHGNLRSQSLLRRIGMSFEMNSPSDADEQIWSVLKES